MNVKTKQSECWDKGPMWRKERQKYYPPCQVRSSSFRKIHIYLNSDNFWCMSDKGKKDRSNIFYTKFVQANPYLYEFRYILPWEWPEVNPRNIFYFMFVHSNNILFQVNQLFKLLIFIIIFKQWSLKFKKTSY